MLDTIARKLWGMWQKLMFDYSDIPQETIDPVIYDPNLSELIAQARDLLEARMAHMTHLRRWPGDVIHTRHGVFIYVIANPLVRYVVPMDGEDFEPYWQHNIFFEQVPMSHSMVDCAATDGGHFILKHEPEKRLPLPEFRCIITHKQLVIRINLDSSEIADGAGELAFQAENAQRKITRQIGESMVSRAYKSIKNFEGLDKIINGHKSTR